MDDLGPRIRQLTKPAQLDKKRFALEWVLPLEPGLSPHVTRHCNHALTADRGCP